MINFSDFIQTFSPYTQINIRYSITDLSHKEYTGLKRNLPDDLVHNNFIIQHSNVIDGIFTVELRQI